MVVIESNKVPCQMVEMILAVATELFVSKGYEKTSIQDIMNALNISKGAIYHHFKSKEEILQAVFNKEHTKACMILNNIIQTTNEVNAKKKIRKILNSLLIDTGIKDINKFFLQQASNSQLILQSIVQGVSQDSKLFYKLILEGIEDGSLETKFPKECSELLILLCNVWGNPSLFPCSEAETKEKIRFIKFTLERIGLDIIDDEFIEHLKIATREVVSNE